MSELISGKEALIAFANGDAIEFRNKALKPCPWSKVESEFQLGFFSNILLDFRLKPETITINGVEIPAPFEPEVGEDIFIPANFLAQGYMGCKYPTFENHVFQFGAWRTEEEIKQVVKALRSIFK